MSDLYFTELAVVKETTGITSGAKYDQPFRVPDNLMGQRQGEGFGLQPIERSNLEEARINNLARLLVLFASGNWFEMNAARDEIRSTFGQTEYRAIAKEFSANSFTLHGMLDLVTQEEFEFDWKDTNSEKYIQLCLSVLSRASNPEVRERLFYEGLNAIAVCQTKLHDKKPYLYKQRAIEKFKLQYLMDLSIQGAPSRVLVINRLIEYANFGPGHLSKANARVGLRNIAVRDGADQLYKDLVLGDLEVQFQTITLLSYYKARKAVAPLLYGLVELKDERLLTLIRKILEGQYAHLYKLVLRELSRKDGRFSSLVV